MATHTASAFTRALQFWQAPQHRFLRWGVVLSLVLHLVALTWQRHQAPAAVPALPALEIVMVNASTESAPAVARLLAQHNLDGGGQAATGVASTPLPHTDRSAQTIMLEALTKRRLQLEAEQRQLLTQLESPSQVSEARPTEHFVKDARHTGRDEVDQESVLHNARLAALSQQVQVYNQLPRKYFDAPSTSASPYAAYIDQWRTQIEQTGTRYYPQGTGSKAYGSLRATVTIRSNGSVADVVIDQPSDQALLNQAVLRIVGLAAPFAPFAPDIARQVDQIVITRTWHFVNGALQTTQP